MLAEYIPGPVNVPVTGVPTIALVHSAGSFFLPAADRACLRCETFVYLDQVDVKGNQLVCEIGQQQPEWPLAHLLV